MEHRDDVSKMAASGIQEHNEARRKETFIMRRAHLKRANVRIERRVVMLCNCDSWNSHCRECIAYIFIKPALSQSHAWHFAKQSVRSVTSNLTFRRFVCLAVIGLYRDVWIAAIASSTTSLATRTAAICVRFQGRRVRRVYVTMQITFLTRKSALIYRRGLRQRVASLTLNYNGDFAIRAYSDVPGSFNTHVNSEHHLPFSFNHYTPVISLAVPSNVGNGDLWTGMNIFLNTLMKRYLVRGATPLKCITNQKKTTNP